MEEYQALYSKIFTMFPATERKSDGMHADMSGAYVTWRDIKWSSPQAMLKHWQLIKDHEYTKKLTDCAWLSQIGLYKLSKF